MKTCPTRNAYERQQQERRRQRNVRIVLWISMAALTIIGWWSFT